MSDIYPHIRSFPVMSRPFWSQMTTPWYLMSWVISLGFLILGWISRFFSHFGTINSVYQFEKFSYLGWIPRFFIFRKICVIDHLSWFWSFPDISISESVTGWLKGVYLTGYMMYIIGAGLLKSYKMQLGREKEIF